MPDRQAAPATDFMSLQELQTLSFAAEMLRLRGHWRIAADVSAVMATETDKRRTLSPDHW